MAQARKKVKNLPASILVVHCIDTEGPIGGDVRRRPDGSKEFMDNWRDIKASLLHLTNDHWRRKAADSFNNSYTFNWFIMDFTGFKTNPKNRIPVYNDTYDHIKELPTDSDNFYWHYHQPSRSGIGDQWSGSWDESDEHYNILLNRLVERGDFPEAYRAGGTIEDNKASLWLEDNIMIDYSNRVTKKSQPTNNIFDFNWYGAPTYWGYYHPSRKNFLKEGNMRRFVARSADLRSRFYELGEKDIEEAAQKAKKEKKSVILSYFSHDHRDMNDETNHVVKILNKVSHKTNVPWKSCNALEAIQISENIKPVFVNVEYEKSGHNKIKIHFDKPIYQKTPYIGVKKEDDNLELLKPKKIKNRLFEVTLPSRMKKVWVGGTSLSGNKFVKKLDLI